jgi:hypothetical protein
MRLAVAVLFALLSATAHPAPFAVQVGDARVALDSPPGFSDTMFMGSPRLQELAESLTSASNRILLFALTDLDLRRFTLGDPIEGRRYMVAVTPRGMERERITAATFTSFVAEALQGLGKPPAPGMEFRQHLDRVKPGTAALLAELRRDPDVVSVLQGVRLPAVEGREEAPPQYMLSTTTLILLRGKALSLTVHSAWDGPADVEWIRSITGRWIDDLQRLNSR